MAENDHQGDNGADGGKAAERDESATARRMGRSAAVVSSSMRLSKSARTLSKRIWNTSMPEIFSASSVWLVRTSSRAAPMPSSWLTISSTCLEVVRIDSTTSRCRISRSTLRLDQDLEAVENPIQKGR